MWDGLNLKIRQIPENLRERYIWCLEGVQATKCSVPGIFLQIYTPLGKAADRGRRGTLFSYWKGGAQSRIACAFDLRYRGSLRLGTGFVVQSRIFSVSVFRLTKPSR